MFPEACQGLVSIMVCVAQAGLGNVCPVFSPPPLCLLELKQRPVVGAVSAAPHARDRVVLSIPSGAGDVPIPSPPRGKENILQLLSSRAGP